ncbi:MAG: hypothetical protein NZ750_11590 [Anaerolineae bacterium]|nr:hypothetical protein [Anaerolineae bacterium]MDW8173995.1 hypothetical protein [Anaerolineae bacterium]
MNETPPVSPSHLTWLAVRWPDLLALAFLLLAALGMMGYVAENAPLYPSGSDVFRPRDHVAIAIQAARGEFPLADIFHPVNGTYGVSTRLFITLSTWLTRWYPNLEAYLAVLLAAAACLLIYLTLCRTLPWLAAPMLLASALLWLQPDAPNWIGVTNTLWQHNLFFSVAALSALFLWPKRPLASTAAAIALAYAASFNYGVGLAVWPALLLIHLLRRRWILLTATLVAGLACLALYVAGGALESESGVLDARSGTLVDQALLIMRLSFASIARSLFYGIENFWPWSAAALLSLVVYAWALWRGKDEQAQRGQTMSLYFLSFLVYFAGVSLILGLTRVSFYQDLFPSTRYLTPLRFFWVGWAGLILLSAAHAPQWRGRPWAFAPVLVALGVFLPSTVVLYTDTRQLLDRSVRFSLKATCEDAILYDMHDCTDTSGWRDGMWVTERDFLLSAYRLSGYGLRQAKMVLPYIDNDWVVVDDPNPFRSLIFAQWYLADVPEDWIVVIFPNYREAELRRAIEGFDLPYVLLPASEREAFLDGYSFWHISPDLEPLTWAAPPLEDLALPGGYLHARRYAAN